MEKSLVLVKPDGVRRGLSGEVLARIEKNGLKLVAMRLLQMDRDLAERHYAVHKEKPFYKDLVDYITSGPIVAMAFEGENAIDKIRTTMGATNPEKAEKGTIRADLGISLEQNTVHGSDGPDTASYELSLYFNGSDFVTYTRE